MSTTGARQTLARQWELLKLLPTRAPGMTARAICQVLNEQGFDVSKRQVERDLDQLSQSFALVCNDKGKPYGWHWMTGASIDLPAISAAEALSITMVEKILKPLVPGTILQSIAPRLNQAKEKLNKLQQHQTFIGWQNKVAYVPATLQQRAPTVDDEVLYNTQLALLHNHCLKANYQPVGQPAKDYILHPLGLVQRGICTYLVATVEPYNDPRLFALHRMHAVTRCNDKPVVVPRGFTLKRYLDDGALQFTDGVTFVVKARVTNELAMHISETPLSEDQRINAEEHGSILTATVADSWQLRWWIKSMGAQIEILEPATLRSDIATELAKALSAYQ
ncbi:WYL domain-containing protein [Idiomarina tyrosinivorans]|uniref:WYL domain-containing protein n=1 Tax=Idiomarina tyrosinivorans TaxID=1445662 RepID=A0A432ZTQ8_9GAMM|nr:WYL domain-containing protein [Idiomarina tyrosinivorans]RUO81231.1 WYL domain-containing protein [Idiomarina tyrosinivorans]